MNRNWNGAVTMTLDADRLFLAASLPPLHGAVPPDTCPVCGAAQIPPESDDGLPPPEQHQFACGAMYLRPEDEPEPWTPHQRCLRVPLEAALAWIRDRCIRDGSAAAKPLTAATDAPAPFELGEGSPLALGFRPFQGERPPETCPSCSAEAAREHESRGFRMYTCKGAWWANSTRPGPGGDIPMSWQGSDECSRPPTAALLAVLRAEATRKGNPRIEAACNEAERLAGGQST